MFRYQNQRKICDNSITVGHDIISPHCLSAYADIRMTIVYNAVETTAHCVCSDCGRRLKREAESYGYKVKTENIS